MNSNLTQILGRRRTPADVTAFEREQLRFFLSDCNLSSMLYEINPSLAWLPVLSEMKLIQSETQLANWIECNFSDVEALRQVVANLRFFGPETASILESRFNYHRTQLTPLLSESWPLVIRHMLTRKVGYAGVGWSDILNSVRRGDDSAAMQERLADCLRPTLKVSKSIMWGEETGKAPERPQDLMSIDYEVEENVSSQDILQAWPENAPAVVDERFLTRITIVLQSALADALDVKAERVDGFSVSDHDVPSVARHEQNEYRSGFQHIVRVAAEIWLRLARKSASKASAIACQWSRDEYRLIRRLAMFSFSHEVVEAEIAADMLINLPALELFLTQSAVEAYQLIRTRWKEFGHEKRMGILCRLMEGPPHALFRVGAEADRYVDRERFNVLSYMLQDGLQIGHQAETLLANIRKKWPNWEPKPSEQAGFHIWHGRGSAEIETEANNLSGVVDHELVWQIRILSESSGFFGRDLWQDICNGSFERALHGLTAAASSGDWPSEYWRALLNSQSSEESHLRSSIAEILNQCPKSCFEQIVSPASHWLVKHGNALDETLLWPLWDKIFEVALIPSSDGKDA